ncbi:hypothetical protein EW026_g191 [Hermanssonia centrifuga]|uniref:5-hmdU DNA kinase helical domain-containing protein n=1 Tax=Hermanssonia centrifuga TaxID=98765 RepID=A0A4S4KV83_9APHY|nr:hypothetical protein EW026_g191 [Hermanssonia centrifuga]
MLRPAAQDKTISSLREDDPILAAYPFTNVFRVLDRNSQYILQNVIQKGSQDLHEAFFRVLLFRTFNKIETWEFLEESLGTITWKDFNLQKYDRVLSSVDGAVYNSVYIMPAPGRAFGFDRNYLNHLRLIDLMMAEKLADELQQMKHLKDAHGRVCLYPSMGEFTAMQLILDLNMMPHFNWSEDEWVAVGPGSKSCLHKMFGSDVAGHEEAAMRFIRDEQFKYFNKYGVDTVEIPRLCPERRPGLTMVDIEHSLLLSTASS